MNKREFEKFYKRNIEATDKEKEFYEEVNGIYYDELLNQLNVIKIESDGSVNSANKDIRGTEKELMRINKKIKDKIKLKQELVALEIVEDDGYDVGFVAKPEQFVKFLKYMNTSRNLKY